MTDGKIEITIPAYQKLKDDSEWLSCLEQAGVDNWQGIDVAYDIRDEKVEAEDDV